MNKRYLPADLREQLLGVDDRCCAYCHTTEANTGQPMTLDHIVPEAQGGPTTFDNLCFACRRCNEFKGSFTTANDPLTDEIVPLFHPRIQKWNDHFTWNASGTHMIGLTAKCKGDTSLKIPHFPICNFPFAMERSDLTGEDPHNRARKF